MRVKRDAKHQSKTPEQVFSNHGWLLPYLGFESPWGFRQKIKGAVLDNLIMGYDGTDEEEPLKSS